MKYPVLFFLFTLLVLPSFLNGVFLTNIPTTVTQPDGTKLELLASGDEFSNKLLDSNDYTIMQNKKGWYVYAIPDGKGCQPSSYIVGKDNPVKLGLKTGLWQDPAISRARAKARWNELQHNGQRVNNTGTINNIVVFIRFSNDTEFPITTTYTDYNAIYNSVATNASSMINYFKEISSNSLTVNSHLYPNPNGSLIVSYQDSHTREYYLPESETNPGGYGWFFDQRDREHTLLKNCINWLDSQHIVSPFINLDNDSDGKADNVSFIVRGASGPWSSILWPHRWQLTNYDVYLNGKQVYDYNFDMEDQANVGTFCHEMCHTLSFPDLYHYSDGGTDLLHPVSPWDVMALTANPPQHPLTYMLHKYGHWGPSPTGIAYAGTYSLTSTEVSIYNAYIIASNNEHQAYYLEYRKKRGVFESSIPASGMIIYRIDNEEEGNDDGPPDEVYVYCPNGTPSVAGSINQAAFSSYYGRSAFHQYTNPTPFLEDGSQGGLIITDISDILSDTMTFKLRDSIPKTWKGTASGDWNNAANWVNGLPLSTDDCDIPTGCPNYPNSSISLISCHNLFVSIDASLIIGYLSVYIQGNYDTHGNTNFNSSSSLNVTGSTIWDSYSRVISTNPSFTVHASGDMEFRDGSFVNFTQGTVVFEGGTGSVLTINAETYFNHLSVNKSSSWLSVNSLCTDTLKVYGDFHNYNGSIFYYNSAYSFMLKGNYTNDTGGHCYHDNGKILFYSASNQNITNPDIYSYFNDVTIDEFSIQIVRLMSSIRIHGNVQILNGSFDSNDHDIYVGGGWYNTQGPTHFNEGSGKVYINGTIDQSFNSETFNSLVLNKSSGTLIIPSGQTVICYSYQWSGGAYRVDGGNFQVQNLYDNGIFGDITLNSGTIDYSQDGSQYVDLRCTLTIHNGNFIVHGGLGPAWLPYIDALSLTMTGGVLDFTDVGVYLPNDYPLNWNVSGGTIRTPYDINVERSDFVSTGGMFEMYGSSSTTIAVDHSSNLFDLKINKSSRSTDNFKLPLALRTRDGSMRTITRNADVVCTAPLHLTGSFTQEAGVFTAPSTILIGGDWTSNVSADNFIPAEGRVTFNGSGTQYITGNVDFDLVVLNQSGQIIIPNNTSYVTCRTFTVYAGGVFVQNGGIFTAYDLTQDGIWGNYTARSDGTINLYQDSGQWIDLDGNFYIWGGTINVYGGSGTCMFAYSNDASFFMHSGRVDFKNQGVLLYNNYNYLDWTVEGGTFKVADCFQSYLPDIQFEGGTLEFTGTGYSELHLDTNNSLYEVKINKSSSKVSARNIETVDTHTMIPGRTKPHINQRTSGVYASSAIHVTENLNILNGTYDTNGYHHTVDGNIDNCGTLAINTNCQVDCGSNLNWYTGARSDMSTGTINCSGDLLIQSGAYFNLTESSINMRAPASASITIQEQTAVFGELNFDGTTPDAYYSISEYSTDSLKVAGDLNIMGNQIVDLGTHSAIVDGSVYIAPSGMLYIGNNGFLSNLDTIMDEGTLYMTEGKLILGNAFIVSSTGALSTLGSNDQNALITSNGGNYSFDINSGGSICALFTIFEGMGWQGINLHEGSLLAEGYSFSHCTFRNGTPWGTLLSMNNSQDVEISEAVFPSNTWYGSNNVSKYNDTGSVTMTNATGDFAGSDYEYDPYDRINWQDVGYPDLIVTRLYYTSGYPYVCDSVYVTVVVENTSSIPIDTSFRIDMYYNPPELPGVETPGDQCHIFDAIGANGSVSWSFPSVSNDISEYWYSYCRVDRINAITESDETNNITLPLELLWWNLPAIDNLNITYSTDNMIELTWSYPVWATRFNIYKDTDPNGTFESLAGSSTDGYYLEAPSSDRYFYMVKAERVGSSKYEVRSSK